MTRNDQQQTFGMWKPDTNKTLPQKESHIEGHYWGGLRGGKDNEVCQGDGDVWRNINTTSSWWPQQCLIFTNEFGTG